MEHSPLPWENAGQSIYSGDIAIALLPDEETQATWVIGGISLLHTRIYGVLDDDTQQANAQFIVKACNCHDDLVSLWDNFPTDNGETDDNYSRMLLDWAVRNREKMKQTLELAKGVK